MAPSSRFGKHVIYILCTMAITMFLLAYEQQTLPAVLYVDDYIAAGAAAQAGAQAAIDAAVRCWLPILRSGTRELSARGLAFW